MVGIKPSQFGRFCAQVAAGALGVALVTAAGFKAHLQFDIAGFLFLLLVVGQSVWGGFGSSFVVSILAAACLEYFFIPPVLEWQIDDPEDGVALLTYWLTGLVITRLATKARSEAQSAERGRRDARLLYEVASQLLAFAPEVAAGPESLRLFRETAGFRSVCFFDLATSTLQIEGQSAHGLAEWTRNSCQSGIDIDDREGQLFVRCLRTEGEITGAVGFEGVFADESLTLPLSLLAATAMERTRSFRLASKSAADAQAEMLRSAILDAFAHELKTPLAIISAAAGGLRETNSMETKRAGVVVPRTPGQSHQIEMTEIIENQALRLSQLTTRLLRIGRLDRDDVKPAMELTDLQQLLGNVVAQCREQSGRAVCFRVEPEPIQIMADHELLSVAITQLLENACKYSPAESTVTVALGLEDGYAGIRVTNEGTPIREDEQERIFERFFRGSRTERTTAGAGLGLYVARKIVLAHGGVLELDRSYTTHAATTFRIGLPVAKRSRWTGRETHQGAGSRR